jgi:tetratricopeptide (TPR) repeat protein
VYGVGRYGAPLASAAAPVDAREAELGTLAARASRAEARGEEREALDLHLAVARKKQELGRLDEAADSLRRTIRLAARLGNKEAQARARLDLGDLARARGDLTTACEHWQIARGLFFELKQARELKEAETRMRDHGCPTDWVLNDF